MKENKVIKLFIMFIVIVLISSGIVYAVIKNNEVKYGCWDVGIYLLDDVAPDEIVEIIDLRLSPEKMESLIDKKNYFPGWHMNKKHWYTIILDGSVSTDEICQRLNDSYLLAASL